MTVYAVNATFQRSQSSKVYNPIKNKYVRGWPSSSLIAENPVELLLAQKDKNAITEHMYFRCRKLYAPNDGIWHLGK
jgi:hypothetical protein